MIAGSDAYEVLSHMTTRCAIGRLSRKVRSTHGSLRMCFRQAMRGLAGSGRALDLQKHALSKLSVQVVVHVLLVFAFGDQDIHPVMLPQPADEVAAGPISSL
jgi:hypothetical protein